MKLRKDRSHKRKPVPEIPRQYAALDHQNKVHAERTVLGLPPGTVEKTGELGITASFHGSFPDNGATIRQKTQFRLPLFARNIGYLLPGHATQRTALLGNSAGRMSLETLHLAAPHRKGGVTTC